MAFRPYNDSDDRSILSDFMARTGRNVGMAELQLSINGWLSQMLMVKGDVSDLLVDDIAAFATRRGYASSSYALPRICEVIRGARAPVLELEAPDRWRLRMGPKNDVPTLDEMKALYTEWCTKFMCEGEGNPPEGKDPSLIYFSSQVGSGVVWSGTCIPSWRVKEIDSHRNWIKPQVAAPRQWREPLEWFVEWCASRGLNLSQATFAGVVAKPERGSIGTRPGGAGYTIIHGPVDMFGYRPVWHMPLIDPLLGFLDFGNQEVYDPYFIDAGSVGFRSKTKDVSASFRALFSAAGSQMMRMQQGVRWPAAEQVAHWATHPSTRANGVVTAIPTASIEMLKTTLGLFASDITQMEGASNNYALTFGSWKIAVPYGLEQIKVAVANATTGGGSVVPWIRLAMDSMYIATRFQVLREYAERQKSDPATKPVDAANLQKFIDRTADKADAMIFSSVFATAYDAPSMQMVENLVLVSKGREADVNILDDEQGEPRVRLRDLAKKLDRDRTKGRQHSFFSNVVDEVLDLSEMFSPFVLAEANVASMWSLSISDAVGADDTIFGSKDGGQAVAIPIEDAAFLRARGATSTVPQRVWDSAAISDAVLQDMQLAGTGQLSGRDVRPTNLVENNVVKWDNMSPSAFCDARGYPVVGYADQDSFVRAMLVLKGPEGDPADLLASMFFANTLDM